MKKKSGFIDLHTHGIGQYSTKTGNPLHILKMAELHAKAGTTAILPTIYSGTIQNMRLNMKTVREAMQTQKREKAEVHKKSERPGSQTTALRSTATIIGVNLEGPFLNPAQCGAQSKNSFTKPTITDLKKLIDGYKDIIKIITIAPELPGALKVIEKCVSYGIKVNMGHSDATYKQALDGKKAGAGGISHIFNAMRPFHQREPGLAGMGLLDEDIYIEIIADTVHLSMITVELIFKIKRRDRIILISDSVRGAHKRKGPLFLKSGILAGSAITLSDAVKNLKDTGIPDKTAVKTARENPRRYLK